MDSITQGLLGAVTAQLGFRQRIGRDATWVAVGSSILPDLDIFVTPFLALTGAEVDEFSQAVIHRGLSHSLLAIPFFSLPVAGLWWWFRRKRGRVAAVEAEASRPADSSQAPAPPFLLLYLCVLTAMLSQPLLDWCTSYGTQLLLPVTNRRYAIDAVGIVDIIYTPLLILTLAGCWLARRFAAGRRPLRLSLAVGWAGFLLSVGYLAAGRGMHDWAVAKARAEAGVPPDQVVRVDAYPAIGAIVLWRAVVETDDRWIAMRLHVCAGADEPIRRTAAEKVSNQWIEKARRLGEVRTYEWFAMGRVRADYRRDDGRHVVTFDDMRYSRPLEGMASHWPLTVTFDSDGELLRVGRDRRHREGGFGQMAAAAWRDLWNP